MDRIRQKEVLTESLLDGLIFPLFVLDEQRRLRFANSAGHQLIKVEPALRFNHGRFAPEGCQDDAHWREACRKGAVILKLRSGEPLPLSLAPVPQQSTLAKGASSRLTLMTAMGMGSHEARVQRLQLVFNLTPSEAEIAILIAYRGLSPQECAASRDVSITTVRSQIKALFTKTGASRVPQLITLILQLG